MRTERIERRVGVLIWCMVYDLAHPWRAYVNDAWPRILVVTEATQSASPRPWTHSRKLLPES